MSGSIQGSSQVIPKHNLVENAAVLAVDTAIAAVASVCDPPAALASALGMNTHGMVHDRYAAVGRAYEDTTASLEDLVNKAKKALELN